MQILVVDDFSSMRRVVRNLLGELGFRDSHIREADSGNHALDVLHTSSVDLVVTDWNMPGMTGMDLLQAIRGDPALKHLLVLMVTAETSREQVVAAIQAGVDAYLIKPFTAITLGRNIDRAYGRQAATIPYPSAPATA